MQGKYENQCDQAVEPASQIEDAISGLAANINGLHDMLSTAERRFDAVLLPVPPQADTKGGGLTAAAVESQVLYRINALKQRVIDANNRLGALIGRAQV